MHRNSIHVPVPFQNIQSCLFSHIPRISFCHFTVISKLILLPWINKNNQNFHTQLLGVWNGIITLEHCLAISNKVKIHVHYNPEIPHLAGYSREMNLYVHKTLQKIFIAALFIINKNPMSINRRTTKLWFIHTMKYYSTIQRHELLIRTIACMNLIKLIEQKKPDAKEYKFFALMYMKF